MRMIFEEKTKSIPITKQMVWEAYKLVKKNKGGAGVDGQSLQEFEKVRVQELYKLWNRLASGSYFPNDVKRVEIEKGGGKTRPLGIPTVADRIAQQVIKTYLEPRLELEFLDVSYGYRPKKSAHMAVEEVRNNVRKYSWVIDIDVQEFFEQVDHVLLYKALEVHVTESWVNMYIKRWLETPVLLAEGIQKHPNGKGTPQGGVISPLLSNLYLHYCLDKWLAIHYPQVKMVRYADDVIIHCSTEGQANYLLEKVGTRLKACGLNLHPEKTKIVYCKKSGRNLSRESLQFDFLGFSFQPMVTRLRKGGVFLQYDCKMSRKSKTGILSDLRKMSLHKKTQCTIQDLSLRLNPKLRGWINYYGKVSRKSMKPIFYYLHHRLIKWVIKKYKRFKRSRVKAVQWLRCLRQQYPNLFYHWSLGYHLT